MPRSGRHAWLQSRPGAEERSTDRFVWATHSALACLFAGLAAFAAIDPSAFREAMQEDALAEWATFWLFAVAGAGALAGAIQMANSSNARESARPRAAVLLGLAAFCLFVAGEEISWGQRLFGFRPPEFFVESNYQQELNLHNLFMEVVKTKVLVAAIALGYGVLLPALARLRSRAEHWPGRWIRAAVPSAGLWPWFLLVALVELSYPVSYAGEAAELALGAIFLADIWLRAASIPTVRQVSTPLAVVTMVLAVLVLSRGTMVASSLVAAAGDEALLERADDDLDRLSDDLAVGHAIQSSLLQAGGMHLRVFTAVQKGHLRIPPAGRYLGPGPETSTSEPAAARRNRRVYFLDPWHNSYWLYANTRTGYILLYSLGPNRKRDTPITTLIPPDLRDADMSGDDIGIAIELGPGR